MHKRTKCEQVTLLNAWAQSSPCYHSRTHCPLTNLFCSPLGSRHHRQEHGAAAPRRNAQDLQGTLARETLFPVWPPTRLLPKGTPTPDTTTTKHLLLCKEFKHVALHQLQEVVGGKLSYKGRINLDKCLVVDIADGEGKSPTTGTRNLYPIRYSAHIHLAMLNTGTPSSASTKTSFCYVFIVLKCEILDGTIIAEKF